MLKHNNKSKIHFMRIHPMIEIITEYPSPLGGGGKAKRIPAQRAAVRVSCANS